jgi:hypothetical protein
MSHLGDWRVVRVLHTSGVAALSEGEAQGLLGRTVSYSETGMRSGVSRCEDVRYDETRYSPAEFLSANRIDAREIGVTDGQIVGVYVRRQSGALCPDLGSVFFRRNATSLVVNYQGVYLEMTRVPGPKR